MSMPEYVKRTRQSNDYEQHGAETTHIQMGTECQRPFLHGIIALGADVKISCEHDAWEPTDAGEVGSAGIGSHASGPTSSSVWSSSKIAPGICFSEPICTAHCRLSIISPATSDMTFVCELIVLRP